MKSLQAHLLIASPALHDPNFEQAVVLLVEHNGEGAFGLILNRPTSMPLRDAWSQVKDSRCERGDRLSVGGPCEGPLMVLHTRVDDYDKQVLPGVYFSATPDKIERLVTQPDVDGPLRFFAGFAGWGPGQLESELAAGGWFTTAAAAEHVFEADEKLWLRTLRRAADQRLIQQLDIKHVPSDPRLN